MKKISNEVMESNELTVEELKNPWGHTNVQRDKEVKKRR